MTKAYTKYIGKNTSDSHQISPHWVVTFIRFNTRDTINYGVGFQGANKEPTRRPLVVENDCISVTVSTSKTNYNPSATIVLTAGDLNYSTAVAPGDFVMINMLNYSDKARKIVERAFQAKPINRLGDGFKGLFRINSVNKIINTDPSTGQKILRYQVTAYGFSEFNNLIYYNPTFGESINKLVLLYAINADLFTALNGKHNIQEALSLITQSILGGNEVKISNEIPATKKTPYVIPKDVFKLMGLDGKYALQLYRIMIGIWNTELKTSRNLREYDGFNPKYTTENSIQKLTKPLTGRAPIQDTPLVNVKLIDLLKRYLNALINEMYVCYRLDSETKSVIPKVIIRQKPFNTEHGTLNGNTPIDGTRFLTLPRWKISADLIYSINISRNEGLRTNFVHIISTTGNSGIDSANLAIQNKDDNTTIRYDVDDIKRHGLRPYSAVSNFDWPFGTKENEEGPPASSTTYAKHWTELVFDWTYGGHLKTNGKVMCVGIEEDICIGDNLELQDTVYHIEQINHVGSIDANGFKSFRTELVLSNGIDKRSSKNGPVYPEMDFTDTKTDREHDYNSDYKILPGFSDTQDIRGRVDGEEVRETKERTYSETGIKEKIKDDDDN